MSDRGWKEPSTLSFESPRTRALILTSYLVVVVLALPLWWSTTSIERLSLPVSRVDALGDKEVGLVLMAILSLHLTDNKLHLPISVTVDATSPGTLSDDVAQNLRSIFESRKEKIPALYSHLEFSVDPFRAVSQWFPASWMSCDLNAARVVCAIRCIQHLVEWRNPIPYYPKAASICPNTPRSVLCTFGMIFVTEMSTNSKPGPRLVTVSVDSVRDPIPTWDIPPSGR